jgi:hypothetical protein
MLHHDILSAQGESRVREFVAKKTIAKMDNPHYSPYSLFFLIFMVWGNLSYIFGCDYISYGLIFLRFWVCVLIIMAREAIFCSVYYPGLFISLR